MAWGRAVTLDTAKDRAKIFYNQPQLNSTIDKYPDWFIEQLKYNTQQLIKKKTGFLAPYLIVDYGKPLHLNSSFK